VFVDAQDIGSDGSFTINLGGGEGTAVTLENLQGNLNAAGFSGSVQAFAVTRDGGATNYNLRGSSGSDVILSENLLGDTLNGGGGSDVLSGGDGADRFVFDSALGIGNVDTIQDFEAGVDKIMLDQSIFASVTDGGGGTLLAGQFVYGDGGGALAADDRIIYDQVNGVLYYDSDGGTNVNRVQFAQVGGGDFGVPVLTAADFLVQP
jgi:Ca2+-binding RTX toxin-like protein